MVNSAILRPSLISNKSTNNTLHMIDVHTQDSILLGEN